LRKKKNGEDGSIENGECPAIDDLGVRSHVQTGEAPEKAIEEVTKKEGSKGPEVQNL